ncbi:MAG TPA: mechanosensitive ion channel family protein [Terriglobales bacterium]|nr:mechanosensitive ion channel family protein [Terriglobales bacterium]
MKLNKVSAKHKTLAALALALTCWMAGMSLAQETPASSDNSGEEIVPFLNQTIVWYRQLASQQQLANEPSDVLFLNDNRQVADQVVRLAFDYARARAQALASQTTSSTASTSSTPNQFQRLADAATKADQQVKNSQQEIENFRRQFLAATGAKRRQLQATLDETQAELDLFQARRDTLRNMLQFATGNSGALGTSTLSGQIDELARAVPAAALGTPMGENTKNSSGQSNAMSLAARERKQEPTGILALTSDIFAIHRKLQALKDNVRLTDSLQQAAKNLRTPLIANIRDLTQRGDALAAQPDSQDPAVLAQQRKYLDGLTQQYKQLSAALLPLGKLNIMLDVYKRSTSNWSNAVEGEYQAELKGLVLRLGGLAVLLAIVVGVSELWRRATFRYVTDTRRRYQFLLLRRIVLWITIAIIVSFAFASELSSITTFAGLLTAGIAVALQNVILSVAGYFFLIGKYGVRVGDRVQVAGVTGDVVDIGMVRLHLMEVTGGSSARPTGRVVVFSNAVVFQANAGMFKQIPGTNFLWHEITLTLGAESNYREVEQRTLEAVNRVFDQYRERMEMQRRSMERSLNSVAIASFKPESHLQLTPTGLEVVIRYPVELGHAAEIDDRITRELLIAIERHPKLRLLGSVSTKEEPAEVSG